MKHEWFVVQFSYAEWTECSCGYRPNTEAEYAAHGEVS